MMPLSEKTFEALAKVSFPVILRERSDRRISVFQEVEILRFAQDDRRTNFARGSFGQRYKIRLPARAAA
jgi:hypothetical protein